MEDRRSAFTLAELLVVVAISVTLGAVLFLNYSGKQATTEMSATSQEIATLLREAQSRTLAGDENGTSWSGFWGVQFSNATTSAPYYSLFFASSTSGLGAASMVGGRNQLPPEIAYTTSSIPSGGSLFVYFAASGNAYGSCTGFTCPTGTSTLTIGLVTPNETPALTAVLNVAGTGTVSY